MKLLTGFYLADGSALFDDFLLSTLESIEALGTKSLSIEGTFPLKTTKSLFSHNFSSLIPSDFHTIPFINNWHCWPLSHTAAVAATSLSRLLTLLLLLRSRSALLAADEHSFAAVGCVLSLLVPTALMHLSISNR